MKSCKYCKSMVYHNSDNCYTLDKNKHIQPPWYKDKKNQEGGEIPREDGMGGPNIISKVDMMSNEKDLK